ncbi:MAG: hypothetical protein RML93_11150, partial [Anaerolineales bacterium]|nr:hypothetical protein [Anaerolineales bacterium]MDW8447833.1 hypothetical protein [Anaerolineales bacterium]
MKKKRIGILVVIGLWIALMVYPVNFRVVQAAPGDTTLVSVSTSGSVGNGGSINPSLSADGRYVAFESSAPDLVLGDTNGKWDIFVRDRQTGTTKLVSTGFGLLGPANGNSFNSAISADGRYVAFESIASNLVPGDTNNKRDIFVRDLQTNTTGRVSVSTGGSQANDHSYNPAISADGRYVAFWSDASNLVPNDTNGVSDIFVHDRQTGETRRVSVSSTGVQANMVSYFPSISADGRYVAYNSIASNLVSGDSNGEFDVFVHDLTNSQTQRISVSSDGTQGNGSSLQPKISGNGRFVAFQSYATNLVNNDTNGRLDVFVRDLQTGTTERVSVDSFGGQAFGESLD